MLQAYKLKYDTKPTLQSYMYKLNKKSVLKGRTRNKKTRRKLFLNYSEEVNFNVKIEN